MANRVLILGKTADQELNLEAILSSVTDKEIRYSKMPQDDEGLRHLFKEYAPDLVIYSVPNSRMAADNTIRQDAEKLVSLASEQYNYGNPMSLFFYDWSESIDIATSLSIYTQAAEKLNTEIIYSTGNTPSGECVDFNSYIRKKTEIRLNDTRQLAIIMGYWGDVSKMDHISEEKRFSFSLGSGAAMDFYYEDRPERYREALELAYLPEKSKGLGLPFNLFQEMRAEFKIKDKITVFS